MLGPLVTELLKQLGKNCLTTRLRALNVYMKIVKDSEARVNYSNIVIESK